MRFFPNSWGTWRGGLGSFFREFNSCHDARGRFCSQGARRLAPASHEETVVKAGLKNIYTVPPGMVRRFLYNPESGEIILGVVAPESMIWDIPYHANLLERHLGKGRTNEDIYWTRGYIYGNPHSGTRIESFANHRPGGYVDDPAGATLMALVASGAKMDEDVSTAWIPTIRTGLDGTWAEVLDQLGMGERLRRRGERLRRRAA